MGETNFRDKLSLTRCYLNAGNGLKFPSFLPKICILLLSQYELHSLAVYPLRQLYAMKLSVSDNYYLMSFKEFNYGAQDNLLFSEIAGSFF